MLTLRSPGSTLCGTEKEFVAFKIRSTVKDGIEMSDTIIRYIVQCCLHCTNTLEEY
jgi:hypothetical protein